MINVMSGIAARKTAPFVCAQHPPPHVQPWCMGCTPRIFNTWAGQDFEKGGPGNC